MEKLGEAMTKLVDLLSTGHSPSPSLHDIRNFAGAVQGYAELLHEDFGALINPELATVLQELKIGRAHV